MNWWTLLAVFVLVNTMILLWALHCAYCNGRGIGTGFERVDPDTMRIRQVDAAASRDEGTSSRVASALVEGRMRPQPFAGKQSSSCWLGTDEETYLKFGDSETLRGFRQAGRDGLN